MKKQIEEIFREINVKIFPFASYKLDKRIRMTPIVKHSIFFLFEIAKSLDSSEERLCFEKKWSELTRYIYKNMLSYNISSFDEETTRIIHEIESISQDHDFQERRRGQGLKNFLEANGNYQNFLSELNQIEKKWPGGLKKNIEEVAQ